MGKSTINGHVKLPEGNNSAGNHDASHGCVDMCRTTRVPVNDVMPMTIFFAGFDDEVLTLCFIMAAWLQFSITPHTLWWTNIAMENHHAIHGKIHYTWPFSIAMLVHQRVLPICWPLTHGNSPFLTIFPGHIVDPNLCWHHDQRAIVIEPCQERHN